MPVPGSSSVSSAFSHVERWIGFPLLSANTIFRGTVFEAAAISLCSGLTVCSPHRSFPPLQLSPQGGRGFYIRAERASLPPHASEMLSARLQAIGGTRTLTSQDSQHCRLLIPQTVISTACFDHRERSGGGLHRSLHPVLLELHRADVVQRRVHSCSVIPEKPRDGCGDIPDTNWLSAVAQMVAQKVTIEPQRRNLIERSGDFL